MDEVKALIPMGKGRCLNINFVMRCETYHEGTRLRARLLIMDKFGIVTRVVPGLLTREVIGICQKHCIPVLDAASLEDVGSVQS